MSPSYKRCRHVIYQCYSKPHRAIKDLSCCCCVTSKISWSLFKWMSCGVKLNGFPSAPSLFPAFPLEQPSSPGFTTKWSFVSWNKCGCNIARMLSFWRDFKWSATSYFGAVAEWRRHPLFPAVVHKTLTTAPPTGQIEHVMCHSRFGGVVVPTTVI